MLTEELGQIYQALAPVPLWFRYLVTYQEVDGNTGLTLGVLLALVYLIMKVTRHRRYYCWIFISPPETFCSFIGASEHGFITYGLTVLWFCLSLLQLLGLYSQRLAITKTVRIFSKGEVHSSTDFFYWSADYIRRGSV